MIYTSHTFVLAALLLSGCAAQAPTLAELPASNPASSGAQESAFVPPPNPLKGEISLSQELQSKEPAPKPAPSDAKPLPDEVEKALDEILKSYEKVRALLAEDKLKGVPEAAKEIVHGVHGVLEKAPESLRPGLKELLAIAERFEHAEHLGLEGTRKAFGDLSRQALKLAASAPSLKTDRRVFKCGMWKNGYAKWIQTRPEVSNPYFGKEMLGCGNASDWNE